MRSASPVLLLIAATLLACSDPAPDTLTAQLYLTPRFADDGTMRAMAILSGDDELPDALTASVNGERLTDEVENAEGTARIASLTIGTPEAGAAVTFEVKGDGGTAAVTGRMVHPAAFILAGPVSLEPGEDHAIAWDVSAEGERDWLYFRSEAAGVFTAALPAGEEHGVPPGMVEVPAGATQVSIPAATVAAWREAVESEAALLGEDVVGPITGTVGLLRTSTADASPAFADGFLVVAAEVASVEVVFQP